MFCFTFVSDHNTYYIMLDSVQLKNSEHVQLSE